MRTFSEPDRVFTASLRPLHDRDPFLVVAEQAEQYCYTTEFCVYLVFTDLELSLSKDSSKLDTMQIHTFFN